MATITRATPKTNYLNNRDILKEIHLSKKNYCAFRDPALDRILHQCLITLVLGLALLLRDARDIVTCGEWRLWLFGACDLGGIHACIGTRS
jgi:hypothetical protein